MKLDDICPIFNIDRGVKQGDLLPPKVFTNTLDQRLRKMKIGSKTLTNHLFDSDIVFFAHNASEMEQMPKGDRVGSVWHGS